MRILPPLLLAAALGPAAASRPAAAFTAPRHLPPPRSFRIGRTAPGTFGRTAAPRPKQATDGRSLPRNEPPVVGTALRMYDLPPSGGGGPGRKFKELLPGVVTLIGLTLFFTSPLGGIFFAITNSLLALAFIAPVFLLVGFQVWQFFNTIEAPCPNCSAPVRALKDDGGNPTICLNCGSLVRTNPGGDGLELCGGPDATFRDDGGLFGGALDELFGGAARGGAVDTEVTGRSEEDAKRDRMRRERTVIDVDAKGED